MPKKGIKKPKKTKSTQVYPVWDISINKGLIFYAPFGANFGTRRVDSIVGDRRVGNFGHTNPAVVWWTLDQEFGPVVDFHGGSWPGSSVSWGDYNKIEGLPQMSVACWFRPDTLSGNANLFNKYSDGAYVFRLRRTGANLEVRVGADWNIGVGVGAAFTVGKWTLGGFRYDGEFVTPFADNKFGIPEALTGNTKTSTVPLRIGADAQSGDLYNGKAAEPKIWNRALTDAEIAGLYNPATRFDGYMTVGELHQSPPLQLPKALRSALSLKL